jgi:hypothetical protein
MTTHKLRQRINNSRWARRGSVFPIFVVALLLVTTVTGSLIKATVLQKKRVSLTNVSAQAEWLAQSGLDRAIAQLAESAEYAGEEWKISNDQLGGKHSAIVDLTVKAISDTQKQITARARYPVESEQRALITRTRIVSGTK